MEKDKELTSLKKKLEGMVKLNQALTTERSELMDKVKNTVCSLLLVLQKVPSEANPKVRNHGEGPY